MNLEECKQTHDWTNDISAWHDNVDEADACLLLGPHCGVCGSLLAMGIFFLTFGKLLLWSVKGIFTWSLIKNTNGLWIGKTLYLAVVQAFLVQKVRKFCLRVSRLWAQARFPLALFGDGGVCFMATLWKPLLVTSSCGGVPAAGVETKGFGRGSSAVGWRVGWWFSCFEAWWGQCYRTCGSSTCYGTGATHSRCSRLLSRAKWRKGCGSQCGGTVYNTSMGTK